MDFEALVRVVAEKIQGPLPGKAAQDEMAGYSRQSVRLQVPATYRKAAVLLLFFPDAQHVKIPMILRPVYKGVHSGQMAFPGGRAEDQDPHLIATALRETREEIGVEVSEKQVLGTLTDLYIPPSNTMVTPVVAISYGKPVFSPDPTEVDQLFEIPLQELTDPQNRKISEVFVMPQLKMKAPGFMAQGQYIWGASAMIMSEMLALLADPGGYS